MSDKPGDQVDSLSSQADHIILAPDGPIPSTSKATEPSTNQKRRLSDPDNALQPAPKTNKKLVSIKLELIFRSLHKLLEKAGRYKQHLEYLNKYLAGNKVPLGLRCRVQPSFGKHDPTFISTWQKICDESSLKLLELSINHVSLKYDTLMTAAGQKKAELYENAENKEEADTVFTLIQQIVQRRVDGLKKNKDYKLEADLKGLRRRWNPAPRWRRNQTRGPRDSSNNPQQQLLTLLTRVMEKMDTSP